MREQLITQFKEIFGADGDIRTYFAPGRVNLIGEHTDYNGGHVFHAPLQSVHMRLQERERTIS